ncbi:hypothetical protein EB796_016938 [Bugula neritina]|uniref:Reverse transcriptase zinc-binding domain-containing protein n=1 Tax=Bugula neritina TaxID=10212 RepID=A0A7J7IYH9_BUGNE|nr:hypothetical protein EB796_023227 [Bugula neritina]KAF6024755.1 hypothetical protein EB796_016938 [Bugula neritina]
MGGLKTGEFVSQYNIPGAKLSCVFCDGCPVETVEHLFISCKALTPVRAIMIHFIQLLGGTIKRQATPAKILFCLGVLSDPPSQATLLSVFQLISRCNQIIWNIRNELVFSYQPHNLHSKVQKIEALVQCTGQHLFEEHRLRALNDAPEPGE